MLIFLKNCKKYRHLIWELTRREFAGKYRGSLGGIAWAFAQPIGLLFIYTIAFGIVLQAKFGFGGGVDNYAIVVFLGLICFNAFAEVLTKAPFLIINNPNYVKKVVFPLEILSIAMVLSTMGHLIIGLVIWQFAYALVIGGLNFQIVYIPIMLVIMFFILLGISLFVSTGAVFFRDISQLMGFICQTILFLSTVFYSIEAAPIYIQDLMKLNPLTFIVDQLRWVAYYGQKPTLKILLLHVFLSGGFLCIGVIYFNKVKKSIADWI